MLKVKKCVTINPKTQNPMLETSPIEVYKNRVAKAKAALATNGTAISTVKEIILQLYPEYNTIEGGELINSVWTKRKADVKLTEVLEQIANGKLKLKKSKS